MTEQSERFARLKPLTVGESFHLAKIAVDFFSTNKHQEKCQLVGKEYNGMIRPFALHQFLKYLKIRNFMDEPQKYLHVISTLLKRLADARILEFMGIEGAPPFGLTYYFMKEFTNIEQKGYMWLTPALGPEFLIQQVNDSILHLIGKNKKGDVHSGTGLVIHPHWALTCAHVINGMELNKLQVFNEREYSITEKHSHPSIDVALIKFDRELPFSLARSFREPNFLDPIFTAGYPIVPQSKDAFLVTQRGEVTTPRMTNFENQQLFLYSAIARPGNSGGPVFTDTGHVVGIVSESLYYQSDIPTSSFYAGVSTSQIILAVQELALDVTIQLEDYS
jgi:S1-C subfamily serine protease